MGSHITLPSFICMLIYKSLGCLILVFCLKSSTVAPPCNIALNRQPDKQVCDQRRNSGCRTGWLLAGAGLLPLLHSRVFMVYVLLCWGVFPVLTLYSPRSIVWGLFFSPHLPHVMLYFFFFPCLLTFHYWLYPVWLCMCQTLSSSAFVSSPIYGPSCFPVIISSVSVSLVSWLCPRCLQLCLPIYSLFCPMLPVDYCVNVNCVNVMCQACLDVLPRVPVSPPFVIH